VGTDPDPEKITVNFSGDRAVVQANARGPHFIELLEMQ
jgi:hypothetical protein